ncbi:hypothetical protein [Caulobacter sp. 17J80-11]|uniref:hypothetical protein n=1 Tax=Caulobacter sp. 17J80-11 TaxID=2763502 RepID=UPI0016536C58|nr:hypothetical protein [Caulobacter sp. 17J80-11]MBC6980166.1 hypothetical protein [Caulobacter sp. 17J80-11]
MSAAPSELALWAAWLAAIGFALWRGDGFVRAIACLYFAATAAAVAALAFGAPPAIWGFADIVVLPVLAWALLRQPRRWLVWACAFELVTVATHVAWALDRRIEDQAYSAAIDLWWVLELAALIWGAAGSRRPGQTSDGFAPETSVA